MRMSNLEAKLALHEIDAAALSRKIDSPLTSAIKRGEANRLRDLALTKVAQIKGQLNEMRRLFPDLTRL
jgi:hypothetical protein